MLHKDKFLVAPKTLQLIKELQSIKELQDFYLVGGTALALQLGHRNSIDIDLFCNATFDEMQIISLIKSRYEFEEIFRRQNTIICLINNIKTDFIRHDYPLLNPPAEEESIRFLTLPDIAAMKLHAIIQSGKRLKDFIDIYFLLEHFSMQEMIEFFTAKYSYMNPMIALKAVSYFGDIDENIDPPKMFKPVPLKKIQQRINDASLHVKKKY